MSTSGWNGKALWWCSAALSLFVMCCGTSLEFFRSVDRDVVGGNYLGAVETVRDNASAYGDKATVLYHLDVGLLSHFAAIPDSSIVHLLAAEREMEALYTRSISLTALSFVLNDNVLPYEGEDFEKVLVNLFLALDYAALGQPDEALVEARKVDLKFREFARVYEGKNRFQEDAFIRYVAGSLYESGGELNDAFISYRKAYEAYHKDGQVYGTPGPSFLLDDLVRTATLLSFTEEATQYRALGGKAFNREETKNGTILVITYVGRGPTKVEVRPTVSIADTAGTIHTFQVALPRFAPRFRGARSYVVEARAVRDSTFMARAQAEIAEDINAIASQTLEDRLALLYLKSGGRALLKFLAAEKVKSDLKQKGDHLTNIFGSIAVDLLVGATEQADLRCWQTLPAQVHLARLNVPPGLYALGAHASDGFSLPEVDSVKVHAGKTRCVILNDMR